MQISGEIKLDEDSILDHDTFKATISCYLHGNDEYSHIYQLALMIDFHNYGSVIVDSERKETNLNVHNNNRQWKVSFS